MDKYSLRERILAQIEKPVIPSKEYSVLEFGVSPENREIQTQGLQRAIDEVSRQGGGRLVLPGGTYRTGALRLKDGVEFHLQEKDTVLVFVNEMSEKHYPLVFCHWEATPCYNYSPLIYACEAHDIALTGVGVLDGGADRDHWWNWHHQVENAWSEDRRDLQLEDRMALRRMNLEGVPVEKRIFGDGHYLRPNFLQMIRCERVLLEGFTLKNSPMWQINPVMCRSLVVDGVTMFSHGANNDGCDPESCQGVWIRGCRFDTGDDCISLKSGRDRDGRAAGIPCEDVLIEENEFADGHGGVALGSEMSGGIRRVVAVNNHFSSPNLTYALRLKTNARRGGKVEDIVLADSVMEHVHGAAVHGTMLYEDGRNGTDLPEFTNITIENIIAHGGDYGIFLEAFEEVPIRGLVLENIRIDGVDRPMRGMNWKDPSIRQVVINGKQFPRPGCVRILGVPEAGGRLQAKAEYCGGCGTLKFSWQISECAGSDTDVAENAAIAVSDDRYCWQEAGTGEDFVVPSGAKWIRAFAADLDGNLEQSRVYRVLEAVPSMEGSEESVEYAWRRLLCRGLDGGYRGSLNDRPITRGELAGMLLPFAEAEGRNVQSTVFGRDERELVRATIECGFLAIQETGENPEGAVSRQEMATVAMQACGVNYRNASSTMPVCRDAGDVNNNYGTNVARALYFGFMKLQAGGRFEPRRGVTVREAVLILNGVADFAGI